MRVLGLDPGTTKSAWCLVDGGVPVRWGWEANESLRQYLSGSIKEHIRGQMLRDGTIFDVLVIEDITHYGPNISVGRDVFETCKWMGRFDPDCTATFIPRPEIKLYLCGSPRAKDTNIRQAIIDHFGGQEKAIGGRKCETCHGSGMRGRGKARGPCPDCSSRLSRQDEIPGTGYQTSPGVLYEFSRAGMGSHGWSALAVALTFLGRKEVTG